MRSIFDLKGYDEAVVEKLRNIFQNGEGYLLDHDNNITEQTRFLIKLFEKITPKRILEIGTHKGTFCYFVHLYYPRITIDTFGNLLESKRAVDFLNKLFGKYINYYYGNSRTTLSDFNPPYSIDFAWVDGGHSYEVCIGDLRNCERLNIHHIAVDDYQKKLQWSVKKPVDDFIKHSKYELGGKSDFSKDSRGIVYLRKI